MTSPNSHFSPRSVFPGTSVSRQSYRKMMMRNVITYLFLFALPFSGIAQQKQQYATVAKERAVKIVAGLELKDKVKQRKIEDIVAKQYIALDELQAGQDQRSGTAKDRTTKEIADLHRKFLAQLNNQLSQSQVDEIKDGMTYHTVPLTYKNYLLMLPYLKAEDKTQIYEHLKNAREVAMDAGSAKGKHAVFNQYKGKIANYLSAKGYELKYEGDQWAKRRDVKSSSMEITESNRVMNALDLKTDSTREQVRNLIAYQYQQISSINQAKINRQEAIKQSGKSKEEIDRDNQLGWEESKAKLDAQRDAFTLALQQSLNPAQVELVKNEMTAQSVKAEYDKFLQLLPDLTSEQKQQVFAYLIEARENAISVLTSRERNQWFAKYRGRANNYLAKQGYNLRKATEELERKTGVKQ